MLFSNSNINIKKKTKIEMSFLKSIHIIFSSLFWNWTRFDSLVIEKSGICKGEYIHTTNHFSIFVIE